MKKIIKFIFKKIILYNIIGIAAAILVFTLPDSFETPVWLLALLAILVDIGLSIKSKSARKKYIIYTAIIISVVALLTILGNIFGFKTYVSTETENTILDGVSVSVLFAVVIGIFISIIKDSKEKYPAVRLLYIPAFMFGVSLIPMWVSVLRNAG